MNQGHTSNTSIFRTAPRRRGVALLLVLAAVAMAVILGLAFTAGQSTTVGISDNVTSHARARAIAETGLKMGIREVSHNIDWRTTYSDGVWVNHHSFNGGSFTLHGEDGEDIDGAIVGDGNLADNPLHPVTLTAIGRYGDVTHRVRAVLYPGVSDTSISMIAVSDVIVVKDTGRIDSFLSADGAYSELNRGDQAIVATNSISKEKIKVENSGHIGGDAFAGPGGDISKVIKVSASGTITGDKDVLPEKVSLPTPPIPNLGASVGDRQYTAGTTVLSGNLRCNKLTIKSSAILEIDGQVAIVCDGEVLLENSAQIQLRPGATLKLYTARKFKTRDTSQINVNTADPSRVFIYHMSGDHVDFEGTSRVYATVIAPWGLLHVKGQSQFFGTFAGKKVEVKNQGQLHHDLSTGFPPYIPPVVDTALSVSDKIELAGSARIDSFDSRQGPYGGANIGSDATISTNQVASDKIDLKDSTILFGSAYVGVGGKPAVVIKKAAGAQITGATGSLPSPITTPDTDAPTDVPQQGEYKVSSGTVTFSGDLNCSKFTLDGSAILQIDDETRIYSRGDLIVKDNAQIHILDGGSLEMYGPAIIRFSNNAQVNINTGDPTYVTLYNLGTTKIELLGSAQFCGTIFSPKAEFNAKDNTHFYGTFKGKNVKAEQSAQLHLDMANVLVQEGEAGGVALVRWVEMN